MIFGLTGRARSGKDTAALALRPLGFVRVAFADPMRDMLRAIGLRDEDMEGDAKERPVPHLGLSYRRLAQTLGTEWGRALDPDLWIKVARSRIERVIAEGRSVVVTDIRFDNEAALVRHMGGRVIRIDREEAAAVLKHTSEAGVNHALIDATVFNNDSLDEFRARVVRLTNEWS